jgi:dihydrofolate synthase/folylpolyglutamate synthase
MVIGDMDAEAGAVIAAIVRDRGAPLIRATDGVSALRRPGTATVALQTPVRDYGEVVVGLKGAHQVGNAVVAVRILELLDQQGVAVPPAAIVSGLSRPSWPGRLDLRRLPDGREILFDAAHNPAGAAALASYLRERGAERLPLVFAGMRDKDVEGMLRAIIPAVGPLVVTRASNRRSSDPESLAELARRIAPDVAVTIAASPVEALDIAWRASSRIIVAGSIFLLGDVMKTARPLMIPFENSA